MANATRKSRTTGNYSKPKSTGSTTRRKTNTAASASKNIDKAPRRKKPKKKQVSAETKEEVLIFLLFAFFVFVLLCMINVVKGFLGEAVKHIMLGIFGIVGYFIPLGLLIGALFKLSNKHNVIATIKLISAIALVFIVGILLCQVSTLNVSSVAESSTLIKDLYDSQEKGGIIFGLCAVLLFKALGNAGTWFVCIIGAIIAFLLLTEKNFLRRIFNRTNPFNSSYDEEDDDDYEDEPKRKLSRQEIIERDNELRKQQAEERRKKYELRQIKEQEKEEARKLKEEEKIKAIEEKKKALEDKEKLKDIRDDERILNTTIQGNSSYDAIGLDLSVPLLEQKKRISKDDIHEITLHDSLIDMSNVDTNMSDNVQNDSDEILSSEEVIDISKLDKTSEILSVDDDQFLNSINLEKEIIGNTEYSENSVVTTDKDVNTVDETVSDELDNIISNDNIVASETIDTKVTESEELVTDNHIGGDISAMPTPVTEKSHEGNAKPEDKPRPKPKAYTYPDYSLLTKNTKKNSGDSEIELQSTALKLQNTLKTFGVGVTVSDISQGPSVTRYELTLDEGIKVSKIVGLQDDIKLNLAAQDIRIEAPIPGKAAVGIEIPNKETSPVLIRDLLETKEFDNAESKITFAVGKDISGKTIVADIAKMPHMLIAGATGAGKSVCINTLIMSILYKADPVDVKLIMIDPKVVELSVYNGIPHLLLPVVTDPRKASAALQWAVSEMDKRYKAFAAHNVRDLKGFNQKIKGLNNKGDYSEAPKPNIVVIVDELADLMMVASKEVEESICRLAQLARAAGIHLIIATQRPSVDVITGLIKANMPSRVAFKVSSGVDSRTILDTVGAEKLLGKGDMLFYPQGYSKPLRVQGAFVSDQEVSDVVEFLKSNASDDVYDNDVEAQISGISTGSSGSNSQSDGSQDLDEYFKEACRLVVEREKASSGMLQRVYKIGFNRAARIIDQMESLNVVGPEEGTKPRKVLMSISELEDLFESLY